MSIVQSLYVDAVHVAQKLDASSAAHEAAQRELEAALEAQRLAHAEVQHRASDIEHAQVRPCQHSQLAVLVRLQRSSEGVPEETAWQPKHALSPL